MKIIEFYKKGAQVVVETPGGDMTRTFTAGGKGGEKQIGYVPSASAKPVEGADVRVLEYGGKEYLLLRGGYVYDVRLRIGDTVKEDVVSAEHGHLILPLPSGAAVESATESRE